MTARIEQIFLEMGYSVSDGPEVETDFHNFEDVVSDETKAEVDQIRQDIIDGTIVVGG